MKKLIILLSLIALIASGMAFAQVTISGQAEYGVLTDFSKNPGQHWDNILRFDAKADDFNTATIRFRIRQSKDSTYNTSTNPLEVSDAPLIDRAYLTTNVLGAFGLKDLPVVWTSVNGFNWTQTAETTAGISPYAVSRVSRIAAGGGKKAALYNKFTFVKMVNFSVAYFPYSSVADDGGYFFAFDTNPIDAGPGKLTAEVNFGTTSEEAFDKAQLTAGLKYVLPLGDLSAGFAGNFLYDVDSDAPVAYQYGVAAAIMHKMASLKGGINGREKAELDSAEFQVMLTPVPMVGIEVGGVLALSKKGYWGANKKDTLNELDINAQVKAGKNTIRVGYLLVSKDNGKGSLINDELSRIGRKTSYVEKGGVYFEVSCPF